MKKELIKEAFRMQTLAGLAPINEVFEEEEIAAPAPGKFSDSPEYQKIAKAHYIFKELQDDGVITSQEYQAILDPILDMITSRQKTFNSTKDVNEEVTMSEGIDTKNICNIEFDDVDESDYPDFSDAYIYAAEWCDTGEPLSEDELDQLNDDADFVHEALLDYLY